jgi:hypothetical protein
MRGAPGNRRPYLAKINGHPIFLSRYFSVSCSGLVAALPRCDSLRLCVSPLLSSNRISMDRSLIVEYLLIAFR